jgi:hypothetical protein
MNKEITKRWHELEKEPDIYSLRQLAREFGVEAVMKWLKWAMENNKLEKGDK